MLFGLKNPNSQTSLEELIVCPIDNGFVGVKAAHLKLKNIVHRSKQANFVVPMCVLVSPRLISFRLEGEDNMYARKSMQKKNEFKDL